MRRLVVPGDDMGMTRVVVHGDDRRGSSFMGMTTSEKEADQHAEADLLAAFKHWRRRLQVPFVHLVSSVFDHIFWTVVRPRRFGTAGLVGTDGGGCVYFSPHALSII